MNEQPHGGPAYVIVCLLSTVFATILNNVEILIRLSAGLVALVSGLMAIRYYHYATKEKKQTLRNLKS